MVNGVDSLNIYSWVKNTKTVGNFDMAIVVCLWRLVSWNNLRLTHFRTKLKAPLSLGNSIWECRLKIWTISHSIDYTLNKNHMLKKPSWVENLHQKHLLGTLKSKGNWPFKRKPNILFSGARTIWSTSHSRWKYITGCKL